VLGLAQKTIDASVDKKINSLTAKIWFYSCTYPFITAYFVQNCMLRKPVWLVAETAMESHTEMAKRRGLNTSLTVTFLTNKCEEKVRAKSPAPSHSKIILYDGLPRGPVQRTATDTITSAIGVYDPNRTMSRTKINYGLLIGRTRVPHDAGVPSTTNLLVGQSGGQSRKSDHWLTSATGAADADRAYCCSVVDTAARRHCPRVNADRALPIIRVSKPAPH